MARSREDWGRSESAGGQRGAEDDKGENAQQQTRMPSIDWSATSSLYSSAHATADWHAVRSSWMDSGASSGPVKQSR